MSASAAAAAAGCCARKRAQASSVALIMGVANQRSIAWSCAKSFVKDGWNVIVTYQEDRFESQVKRMIAAEEEEQKKKQQRRRRMDGDYGDGGRIVAVRCDVRRDIPMLFSDVLPESIQRNFFQQGDHGQQQQHQPRIDAIVHSIGHAPNLKTTPSLLTTTLEDFIESQHISAYSFLETARCAVRSSLLPRDGSASLTTLTYLGAVRAISAYKVMGPAKASLESIVRGLALELGGEKEKIRVNAVSAGPLATIAAKGGIADFDAMRNEVGKRAPLGNVTVDQVASAVLFLATRGTGITGQTIYVDGGYSIVG